MKTRHRKRDDSSDDDDDYEDNGGLDDLEDTITSLKRKNPEHHRRFVRARTIMKSRELTLQDILSCDISDDKRATLLEKFECVKNIEPYTEDYIDARDKLRTLYYRYLSEGAFGTPILTGKKFTDSEREIDDFKMRISTLVCSPSNHKVFEEKLDDFEDNAKGDEKSKIKRWLNLALTLPFDRLATPAISFEKARVKSSSDTFNVSETIDRTRDFLDRKLYGMKNVKERLLLFLNKKLREGNSRGCNIALVGKPGVGKCLHPDTGVIMWDLTIKPAREIVAGDLLLGDDSTPRRVLSTITGQEEMFCVQQEFGETYCVNRSHILTLRNRSGEVVDIPITDVIGKEDDYSPVGCAYEPGQVASIDEPLELGMMFSSPITKCRRPRNVMTAGYRLWSLSDRIAFVKGLFEGSEIAMFNGTSSSIFIPSDSPVRSLIDLVRSCGYRCRYDERTGLLHMYGVEETAHRETIRIESVGTGGYCGFTIDGNERFVLADWTVTHNTAISKALSECLHMPFTQMSFGGVTNPEFLMGHDYTYIGSRPGEITRCLIRMNAKNGIMFFDEFDKATDKKDIMSTLLHITDFSQNYEFRDNYFPELTQDLSKIWFIYSMNEVPNDPAMRDRLEIINVEEYTREERTLILNDYLFPKYSKEIAVADKIVTTEDGMKAIVEISSGHSDRKGVRELERCINLVIEKIYFFLCNKTASYEYDWFTSIRKSVNAKGLVVIDDKLVNSILREKRSEQKFMSMYL